ncbi:MAG: GTP-binding protein [Candidatus Hodarchaeota archaeon]
MPFEAYILSLIDDILTEEFNKIHYKDYHKYRFSYSTDKDGSSILLFINDISDDFNVIKKELKKAMAGLINIFNQQIEDNIYKRFDVIIDSIQKELPPIISLVGYNGVGKTQLTELIRSKEIALQHDPKISANIATIKFGTFHILLRDFTGQEQFIFLWKNFIKGSNAVIIVLDSTLDNAEKSKFFLKLIEEETPFAYTSVICNKQDLEGAQESIKIENMFGLKTFGMIAKDFEQKNKMIEIVKSLLELNEDISPRLNLISERNALIYEFEEAIKNENYNLVNSLLKRIIDLCINIGENPAEMEFYMKYQEIQDKIKAVDYLQDISIPETMPIIKEPQRIPLKERLLKILLQNYMNNVEGIIATTVCDREGFIITSESKEDTRDDSVLAAVSAALDIYIERLKKEFGYESNFFNITTIGTKKFSFASTGPKSILTTISEPFTSDTELRVFSEHIAGKIELILEGNENVSIEIPEIIKTLSKTKNGKIPIGDFSSKLILTGDYSVGKTSLIMRFVEDLFKESYHSTVGVEISQKKIELSDKTHIKFVIWDIGGQITQMAPYRRRFYEGANSAFIVLDRTRPETLESVALWYDDIKKYVPSEINIILVGNKTDLVDEIVVSENDIRSIAEQFNFHYIITSAKTGENVNEAFLYMAYKFLESV